MKRNSTELKVKYHGNKDKPTRKKNPNPGIFEQGYRDDSPYRSLPYIDIYTPDGSIDMSGTGIPLWANGRILPPYSGVHHFDTETVREIPLAQKGKNVKTAERDATNVAVAKPDFNVRPIYGLATSPDLKKFGEIEKDPVWAEPYTFLMNWYSAPETQKRLLRDKAPNDVMHEALNQKRFNDIMGWYWWKEDANRKTAQSIWSEDYKNQRELETLLNDILKLRRDELSRTTAGFHNPEDSTVTITRDYEDPSINRQTAVHELTHATPLDDFYTGYFKKFKPKNPQSSATKQYFEENPYEIYPRIQDLRYQLWKDQKLRPGIKVTPDMLEKYYNDSDYDLRNYYSLEELARIMNEVAYVPNDKTEIPLAQFGKTVSGNIPVIDDAGRMVDGIWVPDWNKMGAQAKKLGAKTVKTKNGAIIYFDDNWEVKNVDDNPSYSGVHQFDPGTVREIPLAQDGEEVNNNDYYFDGRKKQNMLQQGVPVVNPDGYIEYIDEEGYDATEDIGPEQTMEELDKSIRKQFLSNSMVKLGETPGLRSPSGDPVRSRLYEYLYEHPNRPTGIEQIRRATWPVIRAKGGPTGWLEQYQTKGEKKDPLNLNTTNTAVASSTFTARPVIVPVKEFPLPNEFEIIDKRKVHPVTGKKIDPNRDLKSGRYDTAVIQAIAEQSKKYGLTEDQALDLMAIAFQETLFGRTTDSSELGHTLHANPISGMVDKTQVFPALTEEEANAMSDIDIGVRNMAMSYVYNTSILNKPISDRARLLQYYNTPYPKKGSVRPSTEQEYYGGKNKAFYGVPVTEDKPLSMDTNPYGKTVLSLRNDLLANNDIVKEVLKRTYGQKKKGGPLPKAQTGLPGKFKKKMADPTYGYGLEWFKNWYSHPETQKRLEQSGLDQENIQYAYENIGDTQFAQSYPQVMSIIKKDLDKMYDNPEKVKKFLGPIGEDVLSTLAESKGFALPVNESFGLLYAHPQLLRSKDSVLPHEIIHASGLDKDIHNQMGKYAFGKLKEFYPDLYKEAKKSGNKDLINEMFGSVGAPDENAMFKEIYPYMQSVRYELGVNPGDVITDEMLNKYTTDYEEKAKQFPQRHRSGDSSLDRLLKMYSKPKLIQFMNTVAENKQPGMDMPMAKTGGPLPMHQVPPGQVNEYLYPERDPNALQDLKDKWVWNREKKQLVKDYRTGALNEDAVEWEGYKIPLFKDQSVKRITPPDYNLIGDQLPMHPGVMKTGGSQWLQKYQKKGNVLYVGDPNDPALKAYQDSSSLYNASKKAWEFFVNRELNEATERWRRYQVSSASPEDKEKWPKPKRSDYWTYEEAKKSHRAEGTDFSKAKLKREKSNWDNSTSTYLYLDPNDPYEFGYLVDYDDPGSTLAVYARNFNNPIKPTHAIWSEGVSDVLYKEPVLKVVLDPSRAPISPMPMKGFETPEIQPAQLDPNTRVYQDMPFRVNEIYDDPKDQYSRTYEIKNEKGKWIKTSQAHYDQVKKLWLKNNKKAYGGPLPMHQTPPGQVKYQLPRSVFSPDYRRLRYDIPMLSSNGPGDIIYIDTKGKKGIPTSEFEERAALHADSLDAFNFTNRALEYLDRYKTAQVNTNPYYFYKYYDFDHFKNDVENEGKGLQNMFSNVKPIRYFTYTDKQGHVVKIPIYKEPVIDIGAKYYPEGGFLEDASSAISGVLSSASNWLHETLPETLNNAGESLQESWDKLTAEGASFFNGTPPPPPKPPIKTQDKPSPPPKPGPKPAPKPTQVVTPQIVTAKPDTSYASRPTPQVVPEQEVPFRMNQTQNYFDPSKGNDQYAITYEIIGPQGKWIKTSQAAYEQVKKNWESKNKKQKQTGGPHELPAHLPEAYKTGGWLESYQAPTTDKSNEFTYNGTKFVLRNDESTNWVPKYYAVGYGAGPSLPVYTEINSKSFSKELDDFRRQAISNVSGPGFTVKNAVEKAPPVVQKNLLGDMSIQKAVKDNTSTSLDKRNIKQELELKDRLAREEEAQRTGTISEMKGPWNKEEAEFGKAQRQMFGLRMGMPTAEAAEIGTTGTAPALWAPATAGTYLLGANTVAPVLNWFNNTLVGQGLNVGLGAHAAINYPETLSEYWKKRQEGNVDFGTAANVILDPLFMQAGIQSGRTLFNRGRNAYNFLGNRLNRFMWGDDVINTPVINTPTVLPGSSNLSQRINLGVNRVRTKRIKAFKEDVIPGTSLKVGRRYINNLEIPRSIKITGNSGQLTASPMGDNTWYLSTEMTSPFEAGKAMKVLHGFFPKPYPKLIEPKSLSPDSFKGWLNAAKSNDFTYSFTGNYIDLNNQHVHSKIFEGLNVTTGPVNDAATFSSAKDAMKALNRVNKELLGKKGFTEKATTARNSDGTYTIKIPSYQLNRNWKSGGDIKNDNFTKSNKNWLDKYE